MEVSTGLSTRTNARALNRNSDEIEIGDIQTSQLESLSMESLEIFRENVRIFRHNASRLLFIAVVLIIPVSAVFLSNGLVHQSVVKWLARHFLLLANSNGLPLELLFKPFFHTLSEIAVSNAMCFPLYMTLLLMSKATVVYFVECTYSRKRFHLSMFSTFISKIWRCTLSTFLLSCGLISSGFFSFIAILDVISRFFFVMECFSCVLEVPVLIIELVFKSVLANVMIICNISIVISIHEKVSATQAFLGSASLLRGKNRVDLLMFLGSTVAMNLVQNFFEQRVRTQSNREGFLGIWETPILVVMYSFLLLIDSLMNTLFYFSCKYRETPSAEESKPDSECCS